MRYVDSQHQYEKIAAELHETIKNIKINTHEKSMDYCHYYYCCISIMVA